MKTRSIFAAGLLSLVLLAACAPAAKPVPAQSELPEQSVPGATPSPVPPTLEPAEVQAQPVQTEVPATEAPSEVPQAAATSRGPDLEATDPATVNLASGGLQLVEFFRFT